MSDDSEQNRSEEPTSFKLTRAREKGSVARGTDLGFFTALATFLGYLWMAGPSLVDQLSLVTARTLVSAGAGISGGDAIIGYAGRVLTSAVRPLIMMAAAIFAVVAVFELVQTGGLIFSFEPLRPDFSRLSPAKGLKRLFSVRLLIETLKNVFKIAAYSALTYLLVRQAMISTAATVGDAGHLAQSLGQLGLRLLAYFAAAALVFAVIDQLIVRRDFLKRMRMSRREIRRESRDREGEPRMKQRRKKLHAEFVKLSQSLKGIRSADVLITNPSHYAVALHYDPRTMVAPRIVSQGSHAIAQRLKRLAFIYGVTVIRKPALARALYAKGQLNVEIPDLFYQAVADVYLEMRAASAASKAQATAHA